MGLFFVFLYSLLITDHVIAENGLHDVIPLLKELASLDIYEGDDELEAFVMPSWASRNGGKVIVNVDSFGAMGDGIADDTQVNLELTTAVCNFFDNNYACLVFMTTSNALYPPLPFPPLLPKPLGFHQCMGPSLLYTKISLAGSWRASLSGQCDKIQRPMCK